ncbi:hypothetical protein ESCO_001258 [Escovopsis weberi]|uniref:2EXR domain-containing protein n=1 Tax=Escovopsis weberi TaxID=150374 RepID=A0A0M8MVJ6_ESCWE|nr:hypothetical protein ESCO_001258 [Escovopsis weberi]
MATAFHLFPQLPYELRAMIWSFAAHPRNVRIKPRRGGTWEALFYFVSLPAPQAPAVMHACREARQHVPY